MFNWLRNSYKLLASIIGIISILGVIATGTITVYSAGEDLKNVKKDVSDVKSSQVQFMDNINKSMQLQFDAMRLQILTDHGNQIDTMLIKKPKNKALLDMKAKIEKDKADTLTKIMHSTNGK